MNNIEYSRQGTPVYDTLEAEKEKYKYDSFHLACLKPTKNPNR